jgi:hypothetical protein
MPLQLFATIDNAANHAFPIMKAAVPHGTPPSNPIAKNNKGGVLYCFLPVLIFREAPAIETLGNETHHRAHPAPTAKPSTADRVMDRSID